MFPTLADQIASAVSSLDPAAPSTPDTLPLRAACAGLVSLALALWLGPRLIAWLRARFREPIKCDSPEIRLQHLAKQATPTMGGLFLVAGIAGALVLFADLRNVGVQAALVLALGMAAVGAIDDLVKIRTHASGLAPRTKLLGQTLVATAAVLLLYEQYARIPEALALTLPFGAGQLQLGSWFVPLAILVVVGSANAVNLADGLDGLAGGCLVFAVGALGAVACACAHEPWAAALGLPPLPVAGEMVVLAAAMLGAVLGFLWFNCHPAQVFMGDTGSLPLGALMGLLAVVTRQEIRLVLIGGVFVAEAISVMLQVGYFRWRRKRLLRCAPLHHHFQLLGWPETRVVVRFWIAAALCAALGLATLALPRAPHGLKQVVSVAAAPSAAPR